MTLKEWCEENNKEELLNEWHPTKNNTLLPDNVSYSSGKKIWWQCLQGHEWEAKVGSRIRGSGCPYCSNRAVLKGFNDLATVRPEIAKEWHPIKNENLKPTDVVYGRNKRVWWQCAEGHEWQAFVNQRTQKNGSGCPYCSNKAVLKGYNDLATTNPDIAKEWHPTKNRDLKPTDITYGRNQKVWWQCAKGHEWQATISSRTGRGHGCPYCAGQRVLKGSNDLATVRPDIAKEWHPTRNNNLTPSDVTCGSSIKVWWRCQYGHEWESTIGNRVYKKIKCPKCSGNGTSLSEQGVAFYLEQVCKVEQRTKLSGQEIDVYLPEYKIGIEYDGRFYHTKEKRDREISKDKKVTDAGVTLIRIKESDRNVAENKIIYFKKDILGDSYAWALNQLCQMLVALTGNTQFSSIKIDIDNDIVKIRERIDLYSKERGFSALYPDVAKEWHPEKNGNLTPEMFTAGSKFKVWWKCSLGHEWKASVVNRVRGRGCPYCSNRFVLKGFNDLATVRPDIAKEWHPTKNEDLKPTDVVCGCNKKVWWRCSLGHEWQAMISNRTGKNKTGCPYCRRKHVALIQPMSRVTPTQERSPA